jgi:hypothetical protein
LSCYEDKTSEYHIAYRSNLTAICHKCTTANTRPDKDDGSSVTCVGYRKTEWLGAAASWATYDPELSNTLDGVTFIGWIPGKLTAENSARRFQSGTLWSYQWTPL